MSEGKKINVRKIAVSGVLGALSVILGMTPVGFIPVGPTRATIMHIPVIIGAIIEGPVVGGFVGLIFGLSSLYQAVTSPTPVSFVFLNPLVSILPRVLIGITSYYVFKALRSIGSRKTAILLNIIWVAIAGYLVYGICGIIRNSGGVWLLAANAVLLVLAAVMMFATNRISARKPLDIAAAAVAGTLTNTVLVLGLIYLVYAESFVKALGMDASLAGKIIFGIGVSNGIPEIIAAVLIVTAVAGAVMKYRRPSGTGDDGGMSEK